MKKKLSARLMAFRQRFNRLPEPKRRSVIGDSAYLEGVRAFEQRKTVNDNPFKRHEAGFERWVCGWADRVSGKLGIRALGDENKEGGSV